MSGAGLAKGPRSPSFLERNGVGVLVRSSLFLLLVLSCTQKVEAIDVAVCGPNCLALVVLVAGVTQLAADADQVTLFPILGGILSRFPEHRDRVPERDLCALAVGIAPKG